MNDIQNCVIQNDSDDNGNPTGGTVVGKGLLIMWQDGPLGRGAERAEPNGAFVETVINACMMRLGFYQKKFPCRENAKALSCLETALFHLNERTKNREARGVEGTHKK